MKQVAWFLKGLVKAVIFFTLFAFALNNQDDVTVHFFFGRQWTAPMVLVVLGTFACGLLIGILGMVPRWWRQHQAPAASAAPVATASAAESAEMDARPHGI